MLDLRKDQISAGVLHSTLPTEQAGSQRVNWRLQVWFRVFGGLEERLYCRTDKAITHSCNRLSRSHTKVHEVRCTAMRELTDTAGLTWWMCLSNNIENCSVCESFAASSRRYDGGYQSRYQRTVALQIVFRGMGKTCGPISIRAVVVRFSSVTEIFESLRKTESSIQQSQYQFQDHSFCRETFKGLSGTDCRRRQSRSSTYFSLQEFWKPTWNRLSDLAGSVYWNGRIDQMIGWLKFRRGQ